MIGKGMGTTDSYQGGKMNWERVRPARGGWRPAKHIFIWKCGARRPAQRPGRSRSPDIPKLPFVADTAGRAILSLRVLMGWAVVPIFQFFNMASFI
jgi:hypothetical protein